MTNSKHGFQPCGPVAVEVGIAVAETSSAAAIVAAIVRVARFAACAAAATVVIAASVVIVHIVAAGSVAVATVKVTAASACPLDATAAVNVLLPPHPVWVGAAVPLSVHVGSTSTIVSLTASAAEHWNSNTTALGAPAMGLLTTKDICLLYTSDAADE